MDDPPMGEGTGESARTDESAISLRSADSDPDRPPPTHELLEKASALVGQVISDRYRIDELIALGGMGAVYRASHLLMRKRVAIKILHPGIEDLPDLVTRFEREALAGAHVHHPNIASATDFGKLEDGSYFLVLEYVKGRTLHEAIRNGGAFPVGEAVRIARQIASALEASHAMGIIHRDVKPRNVMLVEGQYVVAKLIDFGLAKVHRERLESIESSRMGRDDAQITKVGTVFGTIAYLAPEAALGMDSVDTRSDLYALGVVFYEMLAGKRPFEHNDVATLFHMHRESPVPPLSEHLPEPVPKAIEAVVLRLLQKDPELRFQSAFEVVDAIDKAVASAAVELSPAQPIAGGRPAAANAASRITDPAPAIRGPALRGSHPASKQGVSTSWLAATVIAFGVIVLIAVSVGRSRAPVPSSGQLGSAKAAASEEARDAPPIVTPGGEASATPNGSASAFAIDADSRDALRMAAKGRSWTTAEQLLLLLADNDPSAFKDREVVAAARETATALEKDGDERATKVFDTLATKLGSDGIEVLYDIVQARGGTRAAVRASALLREESVIARATPAVRIAFELRDAPCEQKLYLLDRAVKEGDQRALTVMETLGVACFKRSKAVVDAQKALRARLEGE